MKLIFYKVLAPLTCLHDGEKNCVNRIQTAKIKFLREEKGYTNLKPEYILKKLYTYTRARARAHTHTHTHTNKHYLSEKIHSTIPTSASKDLTKIKKKLSGQPPTPFNNHHNNKCSVIHPATYSHTISLYFVTLR
jgi:hypothetical protein